MKVHHSPLLRSLTPVRLFDIGEKADQKVVNVVIECDGDLEGGEAELGRRGSDFWNENHHRNG